MTQAKGMTVHLDEECVAALSQLKRQIDATAPAGMPVFSIKRWRATPSVNGATTPQPLSRAPGKSRLTARSDHGYSGL